MKRPVEVKPPRTIIKLTDISPSDPRLHEILELIDEAFPPKPGEVLFVEEVGRKFKLRSVHRA
jgi:hypothetical protein